MTPPVGKHTQFCRDVVRNVIQYWFAHAATDSREPLPPIGRVIDSSQLLCNVSSWMFTSNAAFKAAIDFSPRGTSQGMNMLEMPRVLMAVALAVHLGGLPHWTPAAVSAMDVVKQLDSMVDNDCLCLQVATDKFQMAVGECLRVFREYAAMDEDLKVNEFFAPVPIHEYALLAVLKTASMMAVYHAVARDESLVPKVRSFLMEFRADCVGMSPRHDLEPVATHLADHVQRLEKRMNAMNRLIDASDARASATEMVAKDAIARATAVEQLLDETEKQVTSSVSTKMLEDIKRLVGKRAPAPAEGRALAELTNKVHRAGELEGALDALRGDVLGVREALGEVESGLRDEAAQRREDTDALREDTDALRSDADALRAGMDALRVSIDSLRADVDALREEREALGADVQRLRSERETLRADALELRADVLELRAHLGEARADVKSVAAAAHSRIDSVHARIDDVEDAAKARSAQAPKFVPEDRLRRAEETIDWLLLNAYGQFCAQWNTCQARWQWMVGTRPEHVELPVLAQAECGGQAFSGPAGPPTPPARV